MFFLQKLNNAFGNIYMNFLRKLLISMDFICTFLGGCKFVDMPYILCRYRRIILISLRGGRGAILFNFNDPFNGMMVNSSNKAPAFFEKLINELIDLSCLRVYSIRIQRRNKRTHIIRMDAVCI